MKSGARRSKNYWSAAVTERSNALDLEADVLTLDDPAAIARSLKRSAQASERRKAPPFRSAMSMLVFYINRAGKGLSKKRGRVLERAKDEPRKAFERLWPRPKMIRKLKNGQYRIYSRKIDEKTGKRRNLGTFATREQAEKHERDIQYFKHHRG
jgi:hypothetical protein